jgi:hypothetical protein
MLIGDYGSSIGPRLGDDLAILEDYPTVVVDNRTPGSEPGMGSERFALISEPIPDAA